MADPASVSQLFRLPRELLELIAEYFARQDVVRVLTVHSVLHDVFAGQIWRRLAAVHDLELSDEAVQRYGHLVRSLNTTRLLEPPDELTSVFSNVTHLWITFEELLDAVISTKGKCFERVTQLSIVCEEDDVSTDSAAVKNGTKLFGWLGKRLKRDAGLVSVELDMSRLDDISESMTVLSKWIKSVNRSEHGQLTLKVEGSLTFEDDNYRTLLTSHLGYWDMQPNDDECSAESLEMILSSIPEEVRGNGLTFPLLRKLFLGVCCDVWDDICMEFNFGQMFPSVHVLELVGIDNDCADVMLSRVDVILANPWPSVRNLFICDHILLSTIIQYLPALPNVEVLDVLSIEQGDHDEDAIDLGEISRALPKLKKLSIEYDSACHLVYQQPPSESNEKSQQTALFSNLRSIRLVGVGISPNALQVIAQAPLLIDVDLCDNHFDQHSCKHEVGAGPDISYSADDYSSRLSGINNSTVRSVKLASMASSKPVDAVEVFKVLLECFDRLAIVTFSCLNDELEEGLRDALPNVKISKLD